ncbi:MAG TPA: DMT family transporter [Rhodoblastus sp.]|nr:DMT family transporter [Rhodoblastus sp.]
MKNKDAAGPGRAKGLQFLLITAIGWGLNWPAIKFLLQEWPPLFARGLAGIVAAALLAGVAAMRGERLRLPPRDLPRMAVAAFTNVFAWMGFATIAMQWLTVSEGAMLVYTMPIWVTLLAWPLRGARPGPLGVAALCLGFAGVALLLGLDAFHLGADKLAGVGLALFSAIAFALGVILNRAPVALSPVGVVVWQVGLGCAPMLILGLAFEHPHIGALSAAGAAAFVYMALVPMGACYLSWFAAIEALPPAIASTGMLLVPVIGVVSAALLLGEGLGARQILALTLTIAGVALALRENRAS